MESIIFDTDLIFAIIAINMTVIGLTSLADMKNVTGIDYGTFLLRKYKILGSIRIYHLLIVFGIINVMALFLILIPNYQFRLVYFWCLIVSLIFAIYYFFAYIIIESNKVKRQIYEQEILGFYYNSNSTTTFEPDLLTKINDGSRTHKKMSGNFINYFDTYSTDSNEAFHELLGPESIIYDYSKRINKKRSRKFKIDEPYIYRQSIYGTQDMSHEFFQLFRYSTIQDRWVLSALDLFNNLKSRDKFDYIRLCNFTRIIGQLNVYGSSENLSKYKFLEHLSIYYRKALFWPLVDNMPFETRIELSSLAIYTHKEFVKFIFSNYNLHGDPLYLKTIKRVLLENLLQEQVFLLSPKDQLIQLAQHAAEVNNENLQNLFAEVFQEYLNFQTSHAYLPSLTVAEVQQIIQEIQVGQIEDIPDLREELFS